MKNALIALAAIATLGVAGAQAGENSFSQGNGMSINLVPGTVFGGSGLDFEPTASIGALASAQVFTASKHENGREVNVRYTINEDGTKDILSKSFRSSDR